MKQIIKMIIFILILIGGIFLIYCAIYAWRSQYRHGLYREPYVGAPVENGLVKIGEVDACEIYTYNMGEITYGNWMGSRTSMEEVLSKSWASKETIFPMDGETEVVEIEGYPVRINTYEGLRTMDIGGAIIFMSISEDEQVVYDAFNK